jgi:coenzyme F420-0:L-glutamate ligase/coenzyme F420-1:gamma-L-glutamate ligase
MNEIARVLALSAAPDTHALLQTRRSIRYYRAELPSRGVIERIFASVAMAPSAHNRQPWRFFVIQDAARKARLAHIMGARLAADRSEDGDAKHVIQEDVSRSFQRITGAPIVVVVALTLAEMDKYPDAIRSQAEYTMAVQGTAMATQNLLLAAHAEGLGACWRCAPLFCAEEVRRALSLPEDWRLQGLVTLGYPAKPGKLKPRKPMSDVVVFAPVEAAGE